jgi:hypothetical protein
MSIKVNKQIILLKIHSKENARKQLAQMLADELKAGYIAGYEIETIEPENIKWQISEAYEGKIIETFDGEDSQDDAEAELERLSESDDGGDYYLTRIINQ